MESAPRRIGGRAGPWLGALLLAQFGLEIALKVRGDALQELWWNSHVTLLLAGLGLVFGRTLLVTVPLTAVAVAHVGWITDAMLGLATGTFPLGMAHYLVETDPFTWAATAHHVYLVPLLAVVVLRHGCYPAATIPCAILLIATLTIVSRFALDPWRNVNSAFVFFPSVNHPISNWMNDQGTLLYMLGLNFFSGVVLVLPVGVLLERRCAAGLEA